MAKAAWPFLKEYVLGGKGIQENWRSNKKSLVVLALIVTMAAVIWVGYHHILKLNASNNEIKETASFKTNKSLREETRFLRDEIVKLETDIELLKKTRPTTCPVPSVNVIPPEAPMITETPAAPKPIPHKEDRPPATIPNRNESYDRNREFSDFFGS